MLISNFKLPPAHSTSNLINDDNFIAEIQYLIRCTNAPIAQIDNLIDGTICEISIYITEAFNNNASMSISTESESNFLLSDSEIDCQTIGQYCDDSLVFKVNEPLKISISGSPTKGEALIQFKYYRK